MNTREERVLELARVAWRTGQPNEARVEVAARRIQKRMQKPRRARAARRHTLILAFIVVFFGAAAWAASAGAPQVFGRGSGGGAPAKLASAARGGLGNGVAVAVDRGRVAVPRAQAAAPDPVGEPAEQKTTRAAPKGLAAPTPAPAASWREVAQALDAKDDAKARQALEGLSQSSDATTRAKARLGLAQLAKSRGDCATARRLANEVATQHGVDPSVQKRAAALSAECD